MAGTWGAHLEAWRGCLQPAVAGRLSASSGTWQHRSPPPPLLASSCACRLVHPSAGVECIVCTACTTMLQSAQSLHLMAASLCSSACPVAACRGRGLQQPSTQTISPGYAGAALWSMDMVSTCSYRMGTDGHCKPPNSQYAIVPARPASGDWSCPTGHTAVPACSPACRVFAWAMI